MKDNRGFSLIELIIVIAIMVVLVGGTVLGISFLNNENAKKCASSINDGITKLQSNSMAKSERLYMYLFEKDGGVYYKISTNAFSDSVDDAKKVGNSSLNVTVNGTSLSGLPTGYLTIDFKKSNGAFASLSDNVKIMVRDEKNVLWLIKNTGKHYLE